MDEVKVEVDCQVVDLFDIPSSQGSQGSDDHPPSPPPPPRHKKPKSKSDVIKQHHGGHEVESNRSN